MTDTNARDYQGYTVSQLEELILWELGQVQSASGVPQAVSYTKFPQWVLRRKLNERQNMFVMKSQCIKKTALLTCKANYMNYKLPSNCMDGGVIAAQYFYSSSSYINLEIKDIQWMHDYNQGWLITPASTPQYCFAGDSIGNIPTIMVHPAPSIDGTDYTLSPDTGVIVGSDLPGTINNVTGLATGGSSTSLQDSTVDFTTMGLAAGMTVVNTSDLNSKGQITVIAAHALTLTTMVGGTSNTFSAGNSYEILSGEYGVITSWTNSEQYIFGSDYGVITKISVPSGNIRVDYLPYPTQFPDTGSPLTIPEIPKLYHHSLAMGVVADCLATFNENSKEFKRAEWYEKKYTQYFAESRGLAGMRPFSDKPVSLRPSTRRA
jgi:hypothetical protein